jgi:hypothetical protein
VKRLSYRKRAAGAAILGVALSAGLIAVAGGPAAAATTAHQFTICATGNYTAYAVLPNRNMQTGFVTNNLKNVANCATISDLKNIHSDHVIVKGIWNTHPDSSFVVGTFSFDDDEGGGADAGGSTTAPRLLRW